jgi:hypothetical protein
MIISLALTHIYCLCSLEILKMFLGSYINDVVTMLRVVSYNNKCFNRHIFYNKNIPCS